MVKYRWKDAGLIKRAPDGGRWQISETLWCHVISNAADNETVGAEATGQELLTVDVPRERNRAYLVDGTKSPRQRAQSILTGDTVRPEDVNQVRDGDLVERNARKGRRDGDRAYGAVQTTLTQALVNDRDRYDVTADTNESIGIAV